MSELGRRLRHLLRGRVVLPRDGEYNALRGVWNGLHDRRPAAIVRCHDVSDVAAAIRLTRDQSLPIAVRGGGHSVAGYGSVDDGVVIDLGLMRDVIVDRRRGVVVAQPGVTLGDLDRATQTHGLAVPVGVVSGTGLAGLTLGGGFGWLTRAYGLTADNLLAADVVTADGDRVHASADQEPDLFWGLRGGGGNFGIVTSFELRAHPHGPDVYAGTLVYGRPKWRDALSAYDDWATELPDRMTPIATFITPPAAWELGDETLLLLGFAWAGRDAAEGARFVEPLRAAVRPDIELIEPTTWVAWQSAADEIFPRGVRAYWKNVAVDDLVAGFDAIVEAAATLPSRRSGLDIHLMGGAMARVPDEATPFPNRSVRYWVNLYATWDTPGEDETAIAWARRSHAALRTHGVAGEYVNFLGAGPGDAERPDGTATYGAAKWVRLRELKRRWDPENVFRRNHNIEAAPVPAPD